MEEALYAVLDGALTGVHIAAGSHAVSSILACAAAEGRHDVSLEGLSASQIIRALLHAAAACKQAQAVLLDIQSAAVLYPAIVPLLLQALRSEQRQHLQDTLIDLAQQQRHLLQLELQQQQLSSEQQDAQCQLQDMQPQQSSDPCLSDAPVSAFAASAEDAQLQSWVLQLSELRVWDVLLLLGLCGDPQWEADASVVLLTAVNSMQSLNQISELFQDLSAVSDGAAEWLLSVGVRWATTCYLDMEVDGPSFEQAGLQLLEGGVWSTQQLAQQGLQQILQHLKAEADCNSSLWQVLQSLVSRCIHCIHTEQQLADNTQQQRRPCNLGSFSPSSRQQVAGSGVAKADVAAVCVQQLLTGIAEMLRHFNTVLAKQYIYVLKPLVAYSCDVARALLAAAGSQLGCQRVPLVDVHCQFTPQQLMIKQELLEANQLKNATAEAAAAVTALAGTIADMPISVCPADPRPVAVWVAGSAGAVGSEDCVSAKLQQPALLPDQVGSLQHQQEDPQQQQQQQPGSDLRRRQRYSWGFSGNSSKSVDNPSATKQLQQSPGTFATPLGNARVNAARASIAAVAVDNNTGPVRGESGQLAPMHADQSPLPFLSPAATPAAVLGAVATPSSSQDASAPAATGSLAHHDAQQQQQQCRRVEIEHQLQHRLQLCDAAASRQMLARLLQRVAVQAAGSCHSTSELLTQSGSLMQYSMASSLLGDAALTQAEQFVVALIGAVLQDGTPCSSYCCQPQLATVLQLTLQSSPAALQHVCEACNIRMQLDSHEAGSLAAAGRHSHTDPGTLNRSGADSTYPAAAGASGGNNSIVGSRPADRGTDDAGSHWPMHGMWQQLLEQLLRQQVNQLSTPQAGQQTKAQLCRQHTDAAEHIQLDQSADNCIVALPIVLSALLDSLSQQAASQGVGLTAGRSNTFGDQQQLQELQDGSYPRNLNSLQTHFGPGIANLLGQLLWRLLAGWGMSAQQGGHGDHGPQPVEPDECRSCAAVVRTLLIKHHALSHLLAWMLQHPAASQQVLGALAATVAETGDAWGGVSSTELAAQHGFDDSCTVGLRDVAGYAAAADAAVEVEGSECTTAGADASQQRMEEQHAQWQCRQLHNTASASAAVVPAAGRAGLHSPDVVKRMAVQLQHMEAVLLPNALQQLLAAQEAVKPAHTQQQQQATDSGTITPAAVGASKSSSQQTGQTKQKRQPCQFFVVRTPAEQTPTASQSQPQQLAAVAGTAATVVAAAAKEEGNSEQLLPQHLLQLPILPLGACHELLSTALSQLSSVVLQLHLHQQQQYLSVTGTDEGNGTGRGRARRSSSTAAAPAGSAQHVLRKSVRSVSCQSSQQLQGSGAAAVAAPVAHSGILSASQDAPSDNQNTVSPVTCSLQQQETLQLIDIAMTSVLAWQRSRDSHLSSDSAALDMPSAATTAAAYSSSIKLLQLHQQLCAMLTMLRAPAGVVNKVFEVPTAAQQQQQVEALACAALSAAALLLEYWLLAGLAAQQFTNNPTSRVAEATSDGNSVTQQQQLLEEYAKVLRASLAVIPFGDFAALASSRTDGSLSWSDIALVFGHNVGSTSWSAMKRLQQQEKLLAAVLDLLIKIHQLVQTHQQKHQHEQHCAEAEVPVKTSLYPSGLLTALLQQLAVLNAAAEGIYNSTGIGAAVSAVGDATWLHKLLVSKAQELVTGQTLNPNLIDHPDAARALVKLAQPSNARTLTPKTLYPLSSVTEPCPLGPSPACSKTLALSAHLLCMHHSPRVYAAAETSIWSRQGLAIGPGAGPGWVVGCSRVVVAAAAKMMLQLLLQECGFVQGEIPSQEQLQQGSAAWQEHRVAAAGADIGAAGAAVVAESGNDCLWPPDRQLVQLWRGRAAATAAVLDCCELLLYHRSLHAKHHHQQQQRQQQDALAAGSSRIRKAGNKDANSSSSSCAADVDDDGTVNGIAEQQLLLAALAAALAGPCTAAAEHMTSLLQWRIQQQQQQQGGVAGQPAVASAGAAEAVVQDASAAAAAGPSISQVMTQGNKSLTKKQHKRAAAAAAADPIILLLQAQLSMLLGLGCAAGKLVLSQSSQLLQVPQQQQHANVLPQLKTVAKAAVQQLMQSLRRFSSAYEHLMQALNSAAAGGGGDAGNCAAAGVATAMSELLEPAAEKCSAQSRKAAWAAVTAAAAVLDDSSSDESDEDRVDHSAEGSSPSKQRNLAAEEALANTTDPASRFYDPEVHEELPCSELSESGSEDSSQCESDTEEPGASDHAAGESQDQVTQARGMAARHEVSRNQLQQSVILLRAAFSSSQHSNKLGSDSKTTAQQQQVAAGQEDTQPRLQQRPAPVGKLGTAAAAVAAAFAAAKARRRPQQQQQPAQLTECMSARPATADAAKSTSASRREPPAANALPATPAATAPGHHRQLVPVVCGSQHATFDPNTSRVALPDGSVITPSAFEKLGGKGTCKKWRKSIHVVASDGARGKALGRWLSSPDAACASAGEQPDDLGFGNSSRKRKQSLVERTALAGGLADAAEPVSHELRLNKKSRISPRGAEEPLHAAQQLHQQQQPKRDKRAAPVPVMSAELHKQQQQPGTRKHLSSQSILTAAHHQQQQVQVQKRGQQQGDPAASSGDEGRARNAFVQACLAEGRVPGYSSDEESEDDSDYSDLEDFIVVQPGKDYRQVCAEAGGRLTWKHKWQQVPGAGVRRE